MVEVLHVIVVFLGGAAVVGEDLGRIDVLAALGFAEEDFGLVGHEDGGDELGAAHEHRDPEEKHDLQLPAVGVPDLWWTTLHCTALHCTALHCTAPLTTRSTSS